MKELIQVREARIIDSTQLPSISLDFLRQHSEYSPLDPINFPTLEDEKKSWEKMIEDKKYAVFVAEKDEKILGVITLFFPKRYNFKRIQNIGEIEVLMVKAKERGNNIGSALLDKTLNYFKLKNVKFVQCNVRLKNPALKFWKKAGFKEFDVRMYNNIGE